ncbi:type VI secretion protein [Phyllobacterium phragmitis]|uniref:Type IV secretion system protein virB4 n=1 Tax=Phyllobacterium phragmitis TaxID=2670329 RepID=A0A2S9ITF8_9HYPH|nr:VirB4 family type IV secretion/conjugal transfer ATPase [Phyllobacterium phragmitis]PRD43812.1 type VI secretion protein [Phyllobacterium phragmitis]
MSIDADLKFGRQRAREMGVKEHVPYLRHVDDHVLVTKSGFLACVVQMGGLPFQTMDQAEINARAFNRNTTFRNLSTSRFALYATVIRRHVEPKLDGDFDNVFVADLNRRYMDELARKNLFVNEVYLTVVRRTMIGKIGWVDKAFDAFRLSSAGEETREEALKELHDMADGMVQDFRAYGARKLGLIERRGSIFSEPAEFIAKILAGGAEVEMPLPRMSLAEAAPTRQLFFGRNAIEIKNAGQTASKVAAMISVKEYPPFTAPGGLDGLLRLPHEFILTQSFAIEDRVTAMKTIRKIGNQVMGSDEGGTSVEDSVHDGLDKLAQGEVVFGYHHLSVCVLAPTMQGLNRAISDVQSELSRLSIVPVREALNSETAFWAQLPANFSYIARRALISSMNFAGLFSGHNYPSGQKDGLHWKRPIALLETTSQTAYHFNFHVDDVGNFTVIGPTGSGKTVALSFLLAQGMRIEPRPRCVFFDKDRGGEIFVRALGGRYEILRPGDPTGFAPLQLDDTPGNRTFVNELLQYLLKPDHGSLDAAEIRVISNAVDQIFKIEKTERVLSMLPEVLRGRLKPGMNDLSQRLEPWIDPKSKGWLFNNTRDALDFSSPVIGFDMTDILNDPKTRTAALLYMFHRIQDVLTGDPAMIFLDEGWKLLDDDVFVQFIKNMLKTIRKLNGIIGFGTQSAADVVDSAIANTLIEQTTTNIFFPNAKADTRSYRDYFKLTAKEYGFVKNTAKESRSFLVKHASDSIVAKLDLSAMPELIKVLSGRAETVRECERLRSEYGDDPAAWLPHFCGWSAEESD